MKTKYIIMSFNGFEVPFIFPEIAQHYDVARRLGRPETVIGAGFCYINDTPDGPRYVCYGESISLNVKSNEEEDATFLNKKFGLVDPY